MNREINESPESIHQKADNLRNLINSLSQKHRLLNEMIIKQQIPGITLGAFDDDGERESYIDLPMGYHENMDAFLKGQLLQSFQFLDTHIDDLKRQYYDLFYPMKDEKQPSFTCPTCNRISHNKYDVRDQYCGACQTFPEDRARNSVAATDELQEDRALMVSHWQFIKSNLEEIVRLWHKTYPDTDVSWEELHERAMAMGQVPNKVFHMSLDEYAAELGGYIEGLKRMGINPSPQPTGTVLVVEPLPKLTFEEFLATKRIMTMEDYRTEFDDPGRVFTEQVRQLLVYYGGTYIEEFLNVNEEVVYSLFLEHSEYEDTDLMKLEKLLYEWLKDENHW